MPLSYCANCKRSFLSTSPPERHSQVCVRPLISTTLCKFMGSNHVAIATFILHLTFRIVEDLRETPKTHALKAGSTEWSYVNKFPCDVFEWILTSHSIFTNSPRPRLTWAQWEQFHYFGFLSAFHRKNRSVHDLAPFNQT